MAAAIAHAEYDLLQIQAPTGAHRLGHHDPIAVRDTVIPYINAAEEVIAASIKLHTSAPEATATATPTAAEGEAGEGEDGKDVNKATTAAATSAANIAIEHATSSKHVRNANSWPVGEQSKVLKA